MIIGCDLDGTICDNLGLLVDDLNKHTGKNIEIDCIPEYDVCKVYDITREEFVQLMIKYEPQMIANSPLIPKADVFLKKLAEANHEIHVITARNPIYEEATRVWLDKYGIPYHGVHLLNSHDKVATCKELKVDIVVEDNYHNAIQLAEAGFEVILFNAPHNLNWPWHGKRCTHWEEVYHYMISFLDTTKATAVK